MSDEEIIKLLRDKQRQLSAVELANVINEITKGKLSQGTLITYFKRAFPSIPLRTLLESGAWYRVSNGGLSDEDFNLLLSPWLGPQ